MRTQREEGRDALRRFNGSRQHRSRCLLGGVRGRMRGGERRGGEEEREFGRETGGYGRSCIEGKAKSKKKDEKS